MDENYQQMSIWDVTRDKESVQTGESDAEAKEVTAMVKEVSNEESVMTKEEMVQKSDAELLDMVKRSAGHSEDFQSFMHCDFTCSALKGELRRRGYVNGWHKEGKDTDGNHSVPKIIMMKKPEKKGTRFTLPASEDVAADWRRMTENFPFKQPVVDAALTIFMDLVYTRKVVITFDPGESRNPE